MPRLLKARSAARVLVVLGLLAGALPVLSAAPAGATVLPPDGTVTRLVGEDIPNHINASEPNSTGLSLFADPENGFLFETGVNAATSRCNGVTEIARLDIDDYSVKARGCGINRPGGSAGPGSTKSMLVAVDPVHRFLFSSDNAASVPGTNDAVVVLDELTLKKVATWPLSSLTSTTPVIFGLTFDRPTGRLLVLTGGDTRPLNLGAAPGVELHSFDVASAVASRTVPKPEWSVEVPACSFPLYPSFGTASAYASQALPYIYVPCSLQGGNSTAGSRPGVVRMRVSKGVPDGTVVAAPAPGGTDTFLFDVGADRGYMPFQGNTGTSLLTYDGPSASFIGRAAISNTVAGENNPNLNCVVYGIDPQSGRVVGTGPAGMVLIDGRRTPLAPGSVFSAFGDDVQYATMPLLPPTARHPYRRVIVNYMISSSPDPCQGASATMPSLAVFADRLPVTQNPAASSVDANTHDGPVGPGATITKAYGGNAAGTAARVNLVGSYGGLVNNQTGAQVFDANTFPMAGGSRNVLSAWVRQARLAGATSVGDATAFGDGNGTTQTGLTSCTDTASAQACSGQGGVQNGGPSGTAQQWPFRNAVCYGPSGPATQHTREDGWYRTTRDADGRPTQEPVPASSAAAAADADCASSSPAAGAVRVATHLDRGGDPNGLQQVGLGSGRTTSWVAPPTEKSGTRSYTLAVSDGFSVTIAGTELAIGKVSQLATAAAAGTKGSATASRTLVIGNVTITPAGGDPIVICQGTCSSDPGEVVRRMNANLPAAFNVLLPAPDMPFGGKPMDANGRQVIHGSPGGYSAVVQASRALQQGDVQFNGVPASDGQATLLPGLRIITYNDSGASSTQLDRQIIDLAAVQADAQLGISVLPSFDGAPPPVEDQREAAGVDPPRFGQSPDLPGTVASGPLPRPQLSGNPVQRFVQQVFDGFNWLLRNPAEALRTFTLLALLALPLLVMDRRRRWVRDVLEVAS